LIAEVDKKTLKPTEWLNDKVIMMVIVRIHTLAQSILTKLN